MKKAFILVALLLLASCEIGKLDPKREKLYNMGNDVCERDPSKCVHGVPW